MMKQPIVVWAEIPVSDLPKAVDFYNAVFDWHMTISKMGPEEVAVLGSAGSDMGVSGNLVQGDSGNGKGSVIYIAVANLASATDRAKVAGAPIQAGPVEIPAGRYVTIEDPDGNRIGLFELKVA
jgi:uncharacterized protein